MINKCGVQFLGSVIFFYHGIHFHDEITVSGFRGFVINKVLLVMKALQDG